MAIPDFVLELRKAIGNKPLWLSGATAVIFRGDEILLIERAEDGEWSPVTGVIDPGEEPADTAVREAREEAGVVIEVERLASIAATPTITYANGDQARYIDHTFRCRYVSGDPRPDEEETTGVRWFSADDLPEMKPQYLERIDAAREENGPARFRQTISA
ncbi:MAG: NUDIX hydrolase [Solirubrobacterales bacterium]